MSSNLVKVGLSVVNLDQIASAHWEGPKLFLHLSGGRWRTFEGDEASRLWALIEDRVVFDVATGEVKQPQE